MKENKYDEEKFFSAYSRFPRSVYGLSAAGEWHKFQIMLPDFKDKRVLDLGCGFGWHCNYAAEHGAEFVVGIDLSEKMLTVAREKTVFSNIEYKKTAIEDFHYAPNSFDTVISSLAFHYIESFNDICAKVHEILVVGGDFVFSVEHPVFTAYGLQDWIYDHQQNKLHWPLDRYFIEGKRATVFLGEQVTKYHRTLTTYVSCLLKNGFAITGIVEPIPPDNMLQQPGMEDESRRPMMLIISAKKL